MSTINFGDTRCYFTNVNNTELITVETAFAYALISRQGAQLLQFQPKGKKPWLYCPSDLILQAGKPIDAGIPLCLPWFGRHQNTNYPIHGYLRNKLWQLESIEEQTDDVLLLIFSYHHQATEQFPFQFTATHTICCGQDLRLEMQIDNQSQTAMPLSFAWHSYWQSDTNSYITGLEQQHYLDYQDDLQNKLNQGSISCNQAMDFIFQAARQEQSLYTPHAHLQFTSQHCPTRIIWQPSEHCGFTCIEHGYAFADAIQLESRQTMTSNLFIKEI